MSTSQTAWAHFAPRTGGVSGNTLFNTESCDVCETECQAANAVTSPDNAATLISLGMEQRETLPPELGACDALGGIAVCPDCYTDEAVSEAPRPVNLDALEMAMLALFRAMRDSSEARIAEHAPDPSAPARAAGCAASARSAVEEAVAMLQQALRG